MKFVEDWRQAWRWWSVRLSVLAGIVAGYVATPEGAAQIAALVRYVPEPWRPLGSILIGLTVAMVPTLTRIIQQGGSYAAADTAAESKPN